MANYVSLDEAAKILGITTDDLIDKRSRGEIFGYRDGPSWKFKQEEIERVQSEWAGDALDEDAGGSSILITGKPAPSGDDEDEIALGSDLRLSTDDSSVGSDVALVADPSSGSGVKLVPRNTPKDPAGSSDLMLIAETSGSDVDLGSDLKLSTDAGSSGMDLLGREPDSNVLGSDLGMKSGSNAGTPSVGSGSLDLGGDLELATDDEDDLVLGSDSAIGLGSESGINLMSPSDSGLSLEDEPLDLAGTGISGLDLGAEMANESASGSKVGSNSGLGSGALVDFQQGEEFQLTPAGGIDADEDSGSQVIELEDSGSFGAEAGLPDADLGMDGVVQEAGFDGGMDDMSDMGAASGAAVAMRGVAETPYSGLQVGILSIVLLLMGLCGILTTDILRNLWAWDGQTDYSTGLTSMLVKAFGGS
jgi:hypothetical protein